MQEETDVKEAPKMNTLSDNIWITRKCRILASERLAKYDVISQIIINYYAIYLVALSILDLYEKQTDFSLLLVVGSLMVASTAIFLSARNFKERSLNFKNCYTQLNSMCRYVKRAEEEERDGDLIELEKKYDQFINNFENHLNIDYLQFKYNNHFNSDNKIELTRTEWLNFIIVNLLFIIVTISLFIFPAVVTKLVLGL